MNVKPRPTIAPARQAQVKAKSMGAALYEQYRKYNSKAAAAEKIKQRADSFKVWRGTCFSEMFKE